MPPDEWIISRVCEEFRCTPSQALSELDDDSILIERILHLRAFARAKDKIDAEGDKLKQTPMTRQYMMIEAGFVLERLHAERARRAAE